MTLPQKNATLLQVNAGGGTPDWDSPDAAGAEKFKGRADAYYNEKRSVELGEGGARNLVVRRSLVVEAGKPGIQFEEDDVIRISFKRRRGGGTAVVEKTGKVEVVEERDMPESSVLGTVRLTLAPE